MTMNPTHLALAVERHVPAGYHWVMLDCSLNPGEYARLLEGDQCFATYPEAFQAGLCSLLRLAGDSEEPVPGRAGFSAPV